VIGVGDFAISGTGTRLLASCDFVIASRDAEFIPVSTNVGVDTAWKTGFVSYILEDTVALLQECERLRRRLLGLSPKALVDLKQQMRASRVSALAPTTLKGGCDPATVKDAATLVGAPPSEPPPTELCSDVRMPLKVEAGMPPVPPPPSFLNAAPELLQEAQTGAVLGEPKAFAPAIAVPQDSTDKVGAAAQPKQGQRAAARKRNLVSRFSAHDGPITTLMLSNLPCRVTQHQMVDVLDSLGFGDSYDLLYLPVGKPANKSGTSNLGYGFINFIDSDEAAVFAEEFQAYHFEGTNSSKLCAVRPAHIQGLASFLEHFQRNARKHLPPGPLVHFGGALKTVKAA
jgi:hypothetical protein